MDINTFKNFTANRETLESLLALSAFGRGLREEYERHSLEVPEFVTNQLNSLQREITTRTEDAKAARIAQLKARAESLKDRKTRQAEVEAELAELTGAKAKKAARK